MLVRLIFAFLIVLFATHASAADTKKIVLLAGPKSHGPEGNGIHDYGWSARQLKVMLEHSNIREQVSVEIHFDGWPKDEKTFDDAATIMVISDGRDGDKYVEAPHLATPERVATMARQMQRGCGLVTFHFSTFGPDQYGEQMLDWNGGYFDWEENGKRQWYSAITHLEANVEPVTPQHPVSRGLKPFRMKEEFYYNLRFRPQDPHTRPIWSVPDLKGRDPDGRVVAWARQRPDGGRGFGTTVGHFYDNWQHEQFRKLILNALAWTAKVDVPDAGVEARYFTRDEITESLTGVEGTARGKPIEHTPIRVLMFAGNDAHKWHNWERTTPAIKALLERDSRISVEVSHDIEDLGRKSLRDYHVIVQNYTNWHDPRTLGEPSRAAFVDFLRNGGGLVVVHFANGAFHFSLPEAGASEWPEYRKIVRRVWDHKGLGEQKSGHDRFGPFTVQVTPLKHSITAGLGDFGVTDELYFRQAGDEPIEPLITARSQVTGRDEPLAWTYEYGRGRVFQTLLGHSEKTYNTFEAREMLRRAVAWCADRPARPLTPQIDPNPVASASSATKPTANDKPFNVSESLGEGKFGKGLDTRKARLLLPARDEYREPPLTLELWTKITEGSKQYHILVANELKSSPTHWELFAMTGTGQLTLYAPGYSPDHVRGTAVITDGAWHHVAMTFEPTRVRLFVDGRQVADQAVKFNGKAAVPGGLSIGALVDRTIGAKALIDEVRLSRGVREIMAVPTAPFEADDQTVGLWHFDELKNDTVADVSRLRATGELTAVSGGSAAPQAAMPPPGVHLTPVDKRLKTVLIDRSPLDAYCSVKADSQGRLFVGGREAVFLFEPNDRGGYGPRHELVKFPQDSIIIGLEFRGNDLYVLTNNALYLVPGGRVERSGLTPRRIVWGLPLDLHVSFHCLAWGPDGHLYLNHGDPLLNYGDFKPADHWGHWTLYTGPDGKKVPYTGQGAVLRVKPDGSDLQVIATGLRGPVGLAFDPAWNLFTNDNDHESRADQYAPARLLHVTPHVDFGWPRGWMASKSPDRADLIEPMIATLGRGVPCDQVWYDEPLFPAEYRGGLLMCRWDRMSVNRYPLSPRGSSFACSETPWLTGANLVRPGGICVGRGGRVFVASLYLGGNVWSPYCPSDVVMVTTADDDATQSFDAFDITSITDDRVLAELSQPSWERRQRAHLEAARRGGAVLDKAAERLKQLKNDDPGKNHWPWLAALSSKADVWPKLVALAKHEQAETRLQAIGALAAFAPVEIAQPALVAALADESAQVKLAALAYFHCDQVSFPLDKVVAIADTDDDYLRQIATRLLAVRAEINALQGLLGASNPRQRLVAVLALGTRLTVPAIHELPPVELPLNYTSGNAQFAQRFADEPREQNLRYLGRTGSYTIAERWKLLPPSAEQRQTFDLLVKTLDDGDARVQSQAAYYLSLLRDPQSEPLIQRAKQMALVKRLSTGTLTKFDKLWSLGPIDEPTLAKLPARPESGVIDLTMTVASSRGEIGWQMLTASEDRFSFGNSGWIYAYARLHSPVRQESLVSVDYPGELRAWLNGQPVTIAAAANDKPRGPLILDLQPGSNELLVRLNVDSSQTPFSATIRALQPVDVSVPDKLSSAELATRLREAMKLGGAAVNVEAFAKVNWPEAITAGDAGNGRKLFASLGCAKCHAITSDQRVVGAPSLAEAKRRFQIPHVVESVLAPSKQVAEAFRATQVVTTDGLILSGLIVGESGETVELLLPDASRRTLNKQEIDTREKTQLSPMPVGLVKTPDELRDLLAYLLSDHPTPP
ncbi:MAG: ThuA domain-containing protein [Planctomycetaceae bacterium]|nr:ThuA domain-containing protein [Planctomycetaceae bacterium]